MGNIIYAIAVVAFIGLVSFVVDADATLAFIDTASHTASLMVDRFFALF